MINLTDEEKSNLDFEVANIINPIINNDMKLEVKVLMAFIEGMKYSKEVINGSRAGKQS